MTRIVLYLILLLIPAMGLHAQGKVTVTQSSAIDAVVNGKKSPQNDKRMVLVRRPIRRQVGTETRQVLRRKTPRRGKGFRIAVYSGGNTREDRNKAELAGQKVKDALPDQPVYVHFYSPRWMCLVGNFEEYKDAQKALWKVKKAGYKSANIIRK